MIASAKSLSLVLLSDDPIFGVEIIFEHVSDCERLCDPWQCGLPTIAYQLVLILYECVIEYTTWTSIAFSNELIPQGVIVL
jgi:hypothetical protein